MTIWTEGGGPVVISLTSYYSPRLEVILIPLMGDAGNMLEFEGRDEPAGCVMDDHGRSPRTNLTIRVSAESNASRDRWCRCANPVRTGLRCCETLLAGRPTDRSINGADVEGARPRGVNVCTVKTLAHLVCLIESIVGDHRQQ